MQHLNFERNWLNSGQMEHGLKSVHSMGLAAHPGLASRLGLTIGTIHIENPVFLAPMSGITDRPFRRLVAQLGAGLVVSEMTACAALTRGRPDMLRRTHSQRVGIHVVQLAGCEAHWMAEGARIAADAGADLIDINMGCPARHVTGGESGSALMRDLDHAQRLIEATVAAVRVPVTLKMRLGWDERSINAPELARRASSGALRERSSQPSRIFRVTGTLTAEIVASMRLTARPRSRIRAEPDWPPVTWRAGQPMLMSMMSAPAASAIRAPSAIQCVSQPAS